MNKKKHFAVHKPTPPLTAYYELDEHAGKYRWWMNNNFGDMFDFIDRNQLEARLMACQSLGIRVVDHLPGFCDDPNCTDH